MKIPVQKRKDEAGQAVVLMLAALSIFLFGALGLAIDASQLYSQRQIAQAAADAAAQAAILSIFKGTNATGTNPFGTGSPPSSYTCGQSDGTTPCTYARLNGFGGTASDTVSVTFPTSVAGVSLASASVPAIAVTVRRDVTTTLMQLLGATTSRVSATGTAALVKLPVSNCITVLNSSASDAFSISGNAHLIIPTCGIGVNSSSSSAFDANGNVTMQASSIQVVGGAREVGNVSITPTPTTGANAVTDPLASVPAPSYSSTCTPAPGSYTGNQNVILNPGTYCGGLSFTGNINATFNPGTYILLGGGMSAAGNVSLSGSNLTFYNTFDASHAAGTISLTGNLNLNLSATTSGSLAGMLFFQDRNITSGTESFTGNSGSSLTGALYFPGSSLSYTGNSSSGIQNVAIVADTVSFVGNASLKVDPSEPGAAQQIKVALVQ